MANLATSLGVVTGAVYLFTLLRSAKDRGVRIDVLGQVQDPAKGAGVSYQFVTPKITIQGIRFFSDKSFGHDTQEGFDFYVDSDGERIYLSVKDSKTDKTIVQLNVNKNNAIGSRFADIKRLYYINVPVRNIDASLADGFTKCVSNCLASGLSAEVCLPSCDRTNPYKVETAIDKVLSSATVTFKPTYRAPIYRIKKGYANT